MKIHLDESNINLPVAHSHQSQARTLASNDDGNLVQSISLQGGCIGPLRSSLTILKDGTSATEYTCKDLSDANYIFAPQGGSLKEDVSNTYAMEVKATMPRTRYRHSSSEIGGMLWVIGGVDALHNIVDEIDVYDVIRDEWITFDEGLSTIELPDNSKYGVMEHCSFILGAQIYLVGGFDHNIQSVGYTIAIDAIQSMNEHKLMYTVRSSMNVPRGACGATQFGNTAMVAGGFSSEDGYCEAIQSVELYNLQHDHWSVMQTPLEIGRARPNLIYSSEGTNPVVYAIGGERRGMFDLATGICKGDNIGHERKEMNTLENNKMLPYRLTYPVNQVEIMAIEEDINLSTWRVLQKKIKHYDNRMHYTVSTLPSHSSIFFIGGTIIHVTRDKLKSGNCLDCFVTSNHIMIHDTRERDDGLHWVEILSIAGACLAAAVVILILVVRRRKLKKRNEDVVHEDVMVLNLHDILSRGNVEWRDESTEL